MIAASRRLLRWGCCNHSDCALEPVGVRVASMMTTPWDPLAIPVATGGTPPELVGHGHDRGEPGSGALRVGSM